MSSKQERFGIAVLDDYQHVALSLADWSVLDARATVTVFNDHLADSDAVIERLQPFDIVLRDAGAHADDAYHHRALAQAPLDRLSPGVRISRPGARLKWAPHSSRGTSCSKRRMSSPSIWCSVEGRAALSVRRN
jgi:hypothetical protein